LTDLTDEDYKSDWKMITTKEKTSSKSKSPDFTLSHPPHQPQDPAPHGGAWLGNLHPHPRYLPAHTDPGGQL